MEATPGWPEDLHLNVQASGAQGLGTGPGEQSCWKGAAAYLVVSQLLGLRNEQGAAHLTLGAGEETLILLDHVLHCREENETPPS